MEFAFGGTAACAAVLFTNPLEVVKTRMQLQGELKAKGLYAVHYKNVLHASYQITKNDGLLALQKGLVPALWFQLIMNGIRLGSFQCFQNMGLTKTKNGEESVAKNLVAGAVAGFIGGGVGSPFYLVKTHLQSRSADRIAVGHQYNYARMSDGVSAIYRHHGTPGLFRGVTALMPRTGFASMIQLTAFTKFRIMLERCDLFKGQNTWTIATAASMMSALATTCIMAPFDVVVTRLCNQEVDSRGQGQLYSGLTDCFYKIFKAEGLYGLYKGWGPLLFRLGPHTVLTLVFWTQFREAYKTFQMNKDNRVI